MIPKELRYRILQYLKEHERTGTLPRLEDVATALGQPAEDVGDQLDILEEMGAIKANRTLGGGAAPFLLARGKMLLEELDEEFGDRSSGREVRKLNTSEPGYAWDAFIAHASEDKQAFVRQLYEELRKDLRIWYDEFSLTVGDSLRRKIDEGLRKSRYGIVVLSHNFFRKEWPQKELDGLVTNERHGTKVILPIWLDVDYDDVARYSPLLADRVAAKAKDGLEAVVRGLLQAMDREGHLPQTDDNFSVVGLPTVRPAGGRQHWDDDQARPRFAVAIVSAATLERSFCPEFRVSHFSGDRVPYIAWRLRGPRFAMDWEQVHVAMLDRMSLAKPSDLSRQQHADADLSPDQMGLEIAFSWRGQDRTELHRWPLTRDEHPTKAMWSIGAEILPPLELDAPPIEVEALRPTHDNYVQLLVRNIGETQDFVADVIGFENIEEPQRQYKLKWREDTSGSPTRRIHKGADDVLDVAQITPPAPAGVRDAYRRGSFRLFSVKLPGGWEVHAGQSGWINAADLPARPDPFNDVIALMVRVSASSGDKAEKRVTLGFSRQPLTDGSAATVSLDDPP